MKACFKCNQFKKLSEFYKHSEMADGHLNKCKSCTKTDVKANRNDKIDYYREYDVKRGNRHDADFIKRYRAKFPNKYKAQTAVNNAVRDGRLLKEPCELCGVEEHIHGHHDDYNNLLSVRWLCAAHHKQWHEKHGEGRNAR